MSLQLASTPLVFGINLDEISLCDFVEPEIARLNLKQAEEHLVGNKVAEAIDNAAIAFTQVLDDYETRKKTRYGKSPFHFGQDLTFLDSFFMGIGYGSNQLLATHEFQRKLADFVDRVKESLEDMQGAIKILALGIDYTKYSRFKLLTPPVHRSNDGTIKVNRRSSDPEFHPAEGDARFCIDFVIESALKLHEFDYTIEGS